MHAVTVAAISLVLVLTGCGTTGRAPGNDHRDRNYDPCYKCGETLFDQVRPNR